MNDFTQIHDSVSEERSQRSDDPSPARHRGFNMLRLLARMLPLGHRPMRRQPSTAIAIPAVLAWVAFIALLGHHQPLHAESLTRPNILLIMADDLGWMDLHCQGNPLVETPSIDRLATQGMRFTDAYAAAPVCTPTRAAMMTGMSPARLAITNHAPGNPDFVSEKTHLKGAEWTTYLSLDHVTIAERLKQADYATGFIGKWHLSHRSRLDERVPGEAQLRPEFQGFDLNIGGCRLGGPPSYFEPYKIPNVSSRRDGDYLPDRLADESIAFIKKHREDAFFLCWWNYSVHYPIQAPEHLVDKYRTRSEVKNPGYAAMIEGMDTSIGRVLSAIDDMMLSENTLVIFTSDNGSLFGNKPLRGNKGHLYEGGIRVPMIVRWPGRVEPSTTCSTPVITTDAFPTILDAAGLQLDSDRICDGESILPLSRTTVTKKRRSIFSHYPNYELHKHNRLGSAIRQGKFKLIHWHDDDTSELYDLQNDVGETTDLAAQMPDLASGLSLQLDDWLKETGAKMPTVTK
jgi:arylsulfatase A